MSTTPFGGPGGELPQSVERVRQVRLEHDTRVDAVEPRLAQDLRECSERQLEVVVLLHVEVDERRRRRGPGLLEQRSERLGHPGHTPVEVPFVELGNDRRDLYRDTVDVGLSQQPHRLGVTAGRLPVTEHGLTKEVHVESESFSATLTQVGPHRPAFSIDDQMSDQRPHPAPSQRHHQPRQDRAEPCASPRSHSSTSATERSASAVRSSTSDGTCSFEYVVIRQGVALLLSRSRRAEGG